MMTQIAVRWIRKGTIGEESADEDWRTRTAWDREIVFGKEMNTQGFGAKL